MPDGSTLIVFCIASLSLLITPGTEMLYVIARSTEQGWNAGFVSVLGVCTGDFIHLAAASIGLSAVLMTSASAYQLVKFMGAAYMIYVGIRMLLSSRNKAGVNLNQQISLSETFFQATMSSILNPKIAIFFLAFLPQFIDLSRKPVLLQTITLGAIWISMTFLGYTWPIQI